MPSDGPALAVFEIGSVALGYQALAAASRHPGATIVEAAPVRADRFLILIQGPTSALRAAQADVRRLCETFAADLLEDLDLIEDPDERLLPALFSLSQRSVGESLLVVDADSTSGLLVVSQALLQNGLEVIELKGGRGAFGGGVGFFTGPAAITASAAEDARTRLKQAVRAGRVEVIDGAPASFRAFFNLDGEV